MSQIVFGVTPPLPKSCPTCKRPQWTRSGDKWLCLRCANPNPCVTKYGNGPQGKTCKDCSHLFARKWGKIYHKCDLRKDTHGPGSDHRVGWAACARYEEEKEKGQGI